MRGGRNERRAQNSNMGSFDKFRQQHVQAPPHYQITPYPHEHRVLMVQGACNAELDMKTPEAEASDLVWCKLV